MRPLSHLVLLLLAFSVAGASVLAQGTIYTQVITLAGDPKDDKIFKKPRGVVVYEGGDLLVSDAAHHQIHRVSVTGVVTVFAGSGKAGNKDGAATVAEFRDPRGIAYDRVRQLVYVADTDNDRIRKITASGTVSTLASTGFKKPVGLAVDVDGNVYVADTGNNQIIKVTPAGVRTVFAGTGESKYRDGPVSQACFKEPTALAITASGVLYVADSKTNTIRKIAAGIVSTVAGTGDSGYVDGPALSAKFKEPVGLALDGDGNLIVADSKDERIRKVTLVPPATVSTVAGNGKNGYVDGAPNIAEFKEPFAVAVGNAIFVADNQNDVIRAILTSLGTFTLVPRFGAPAGGIDVVITGSGFVVGQTTVRFGSTPATSVTVLSATELRARTPAGLSAGAHDVTIETSVGSRTMPQAFTVDAQPPVVTTTLSPVPNSFGWNRGDTRVTFVCVDAVSGVATCSGPVDIVAEGAGQIVTGTGVDQVGNSASVSATVNLDRTAPSITTAVTPAANAAGWRRTDATISFSASDALSGIAAVTPPSTITAEGANLTVNGTATDVAGNLASTVATVNLDKTSPVISISVPAAGSTVSDEALTIRGTTTDALSGIRSVTCGTTAATIAVDGAFDCTVSLVAGLNDIAVIASDEAGNTATASLQVTREIDREAPSVAITSPANGFVTKVPTVSVTGTATDDVAVASVVVNGQPATLSGDAWTVSLTFTMVNGTFDGPRDIIAVATDSSQKQSSATNSIIIDATPPIIAATVSPAPNAAGWNHQDTTVTFTCSDATSGIANCAAPVTLVLDTVSESVSGAATDTAGNSSSATATVKLDKTPPVITLDPSNRTVVYDPQVTVSGTLTDALSGVAAVTCDGVPATLTGPGFQCAVTLPPGAHDIVILATDVAGNPASATQTYTLANDTIPPVIVAVAFQPVTAAGWFNRPMQISFQCLDGETSIASCSAPVMLSAEGAGQIVTGTAVDTAGNSATTTLTVDIDRTAPSLTVDASTPPIINESHIALSGSVSDALSGLTVVKCNQIPAAVIDARFTCDVPVLTGLNAVVIEATDKAGNTTRVTTTIRVDTVPPVVTIAAPNAALVTEASSVTVTGTASDDDQVVSVAVNGVVATLSEDAFSAVVPLVEGTNAISVVALDRAGNQATASTSVTRVVMPRISVTEPADLLVTSSVAVDVRGTVSDPTATVRVNEVAAAVSGNTFIATGVPLAQGRTVVTAVATSANGLGATTSINVFRDAVPPRVALYSPSDGAVVMQSPITVTGMVDDIVVGTINAGQVTVTVNGAPAQVLNRAFTADGIALAPGLNILTINAVDQGNNSVTLTSRVTYDAAPDGDRLTIVSGNAQSAPIGTALPAPLVVQLTDSANTPLSGREVHFRIVANNGTLVAAANSGRNVTATTNAVGQASAAWTLGTRAGAGNQRIAVTAAGVSASAVLVATGTPASPALIVVDSGNDQFGGVGAELSRPLVAVIVDRGSNRLPDVPVTFFVARGGGSFAGQPSITVTTDSDGRAIVRPILGSDAGEDNNVFGATAPGVTSTASFVASALIPGPPAATKISGVVVDNSNVPIAGVTIHIDGTTLTTQTDAQGLFSLVSVPVGYVKLFVDGSTAQRPGTWPTLEYAMYTVPGQENTLGMPIYLLPIDVTSGLLVDEIRGGTLTLPELPGFSLTVTPGSATFPGGSRIGTVSVTLVHSDKMPMPPGFGQQPRFIVTIQPPGVHFDPPAAMSLPNVDGLAPGEVTEMYSFDHDLGQFVAIGTGSVSEDGSVIRSDPGVGIIKGGWHCGGNPAASGTSANCGECGKCVGTQCYEDPVKTGKKCTDEGNPCTEDICEGGHCVHVPIRVQIGQASDFFNRNEYVDHDDQTRTFLDAQPLVYGQPLYASTTQHIGDMVRWRAYVVNVAMRPHVQSYKWSAQTLPGSTTPNTIDGPTFDTWTIFNLDWKAGTYTIKLVVTFDNGCVVTVSTNQVVGIRTEDYILYGQVKDIPEDTSGVSALTLERWTCGALNMPTWLAILGTELYEGFNDPLSPAYIPDTSAERVFVTARLLNISGDVDPPVPTNLNVPYQEPPTATPPAVVPDAPFVFGLNAASGYRQAVHAQFKYLVGDDGIILGVQRVGNVFALPGATMAPCFSSISGSIAHTFGISAPRNDQIEMAPDGKSFAYIMSQQGGDHVNNGNHNILRRELTWVFFRFRFNAQDGFVHSNWTHSTDSWIGADEYDFSAVPNFWLYRRIFSGGLYSSELQPSFPIYPDLVKFLRIAPRWPGAPAGDASYPP